jgi:hypothetical protein
VEATLVQVTLVTSDIERSPVKAWAARIGSSVDYMAARRAHLLTLFSVDTGQTASVPMRNGPASLFVACLWQISYKLDAYPDSKELAKTAGTRLLLTLSERQS